MPNLSVGPMTGIRLGQESWLANSQTLFFWQARVSNELAVHQANWHWIFGENPIVREE